HCCGKRDDTDGDQAASRNHLTLPGASNPTTVRVERTRTSPRSEHDTCRAETPGNRLFCATGGEPPGSELRTNSPGADFSDRPAEPAYPRPAPAFKSSDRRSCMSKGSLMT